MAHGFAVQPYFDIAAGGFDFKRIPFAEWFRRQFGCRSKLIDSAGHVDWASRCVGIRVESPVINLDLVSLVYSYLKATIGSIFVALRAGT